MGWFRRKDKNQVEPDAVNAAVQGTEAEAQAAAVQPEMETSAAETGGLTPSAAPETQEEPEAEAPLSPEEEAALAAVPEARRGLFRRFRERLGGTRKTLVEVIDLLFAKNPYVDENFLDELEELLISADLGVETSLSLIRPMQESVRRRELSTVERLKASLKGVMLEMLKTAAPPGRPGAIVKSEVKRLQCRDAGSSTSFSHPPPEPRLAAHALLHEPQKVLPVNQPLF